MSNSDLIPVDKDRRNFPQPGVNSRAGNLCILRVRCSVPFHPDAMERPRVWKRVPSGIDSCGVKMMKGCITVFGTSADDGLIWACCACFRDIVVPK